MHIMQSTKAKTLNLFLIYLKKISKNMKRIIRKYRKLKKDKKNNTKIFKIQKRLEADVDKIYAAHDLDRQKYKAIAERVKLDYLLQNKMERLMADLRAYYQR